MVVMAQKRPELIGAMAAHLHTVLTLYQAGGILWYQYDWRTRREMWVEKAGIRGCLPAIQAYSRSAPLIFTAVADGLEWIIK